MKNRIQLEAGILAGGKSSRMGTSKAHLKWQETTFAEHLLDILEEYPGCMISVASGAEWEETAAASRARLVEDVRKGYGPLEGIYRLLLCTEAPGIFLAAADMPMLTREFVRRAAELPMDREDLLVFSDGERIHPLCGIYKKSCIPLLERLFEEQKHSIRALLELADYKAVPVQELGFIPELLSNINTPLEYHGLLEREKSARKCIMGWRNSNESSGNHIQ